MMMRKLTSMLPDLSHVVYDNACGGARSLRKRSSQATAAPPWAGAKPVEVGHRPFTSAASRRLPPTTGQRLACGGRGSC